MKKNAFIISCLGAAMIPTLSACHRTADRTHDTVTETVDVAQPEVDTVVLSNLYPGYLTAKSSVDVMATVSGKLLSKNFQKGSVVKKGQLLLTIDPGPYRDRVAQAEAALATAISTRDYAEEHYNAVKKALESDAVSKMEVIQSESSLKEAEASIKNARSSLENARRDLGFCTITAPLTGRVASCPFDVGEYINGGASPVKLTTVYDNTSMTANFAIEDTRYLDIINTEGRNDTLDFARVPLRFDEELPHSYTGSVSYIAPSLDKTTGTLKLQCHVENPYDELREGMYVKVDLPYGIRPDAVLVKDASLGSDQLGKYLYVVNDSDKIVYTPVTVGQLYHDTLRVIEKGISPGQRYVTRAMLKVHDGMTVNPRLVK